MITIQFNEKKEAVIFFQLLKEQERFEPTSISIAIIYEPNVFVKIQNHNSDDTLLSDVIIPVFIKFIIKIVEVKWMKETIRKMFYFTDEEEQRQIMSIARSIIDGEKQELLSLLGTHAHFSREEMIEKALREFLTWNISFSFDSFLQFRLKEYRSQLVHYIEAAIDEYKLEQDYQNFVENLRTYLSMKEPLIDNIHLVYQKEFIFYDRNFNEIDKEQLKHLIDEKLIYVEEVDIESLIIAPLISIAPKTIYLYTPHLDHGIVQTIQNIFLERVILKSTDDFLQQVKQVQYKQKNSLSQNET